MRGRKLLRRKMMLAIEPISGRTAELRHPRLHPANTAARDRNRVVVGGFHLNHLTITRSPVPDNPLNIDDVTAMNANEPVAIKPLFNVADGEGTKELVRPVEDVGVVRIGVNGDDVLDGNEMG